MVRKQIRWAVFSAALLILGILMTADPALASIANVYIAQTPAGTQDGSSCANAHGVPFFNTAGNWGAGVAQIGPDTTVHLCGTFIGGNATTFLQFQGSGTSGHVVTILFETGASLKPNYCANCIDLNGQSYILINGGTTCGETSHWTTTSCNGTIQNQLAGSTGATCPGGACSTFSGSVSSVAIGDPAGNATNVEVENLYVQMFVRLASDLSDAGMATAAVVDHYTASSFKVHNMIIHGVAKAFVISFSGGASGTYTDFEMYNSNVSSQCWAMGIGANSSGSHINQVLFHDNEVSDWDEWAPANTSGNVCHTNGTMWFNGDGSNTYSDRSIGDSTSGIYNNYMHGSLTGNTSGGTSASGYLSCQDQCGAVPVFNNIIIDTTTGSSNGGGGIYFNGPGGGGQQVFNNTIVRPCCSAIVVTGYTAPVTIKNNIISGAPGDVIEIRPNCLTCAVSDYNVGYNVTGAWVGNNSAISGQLISLATWRSTYGQDTHSVITNPNLDANFKLQTGSSAILAGPNLTGLGITALDTDVAGVTRPGGSTRWDAGAHQYSSVSSTQPSPPTGLQASAQ